jgi:hypothetical protein
MQLMQMDVDADSQHTVELLTKSASLHTATSAGGAAGLALAGSSDMGRAGSSRGPSNLRHASKPVAAGNQDEAGAGAGVAGGGSRAGGAAAAAAAGGFAFKMFGKDVGAGSTGGSSAGIQVRVLGFGIVVGLSPLAYLGAGQCLCRNVSVYVEGVGRQAVNLL